MSKVKAWENEGSLGGALTQEDESKQPNWYAFDPSPAAPLRMSDLENALEEIRRMEIPRFEPVPLRQSYGAMAELRFPMQPVIFDARAKLWRRLELGEYKRSDAYARTLSVGWKDDVRKRLATGLDDAPVLP